MTPYAEAVLGLVARIPRGRVLGYADVAELVAEESPDGRGGTGRTVAAVLSRHGAEVPWHRVVRSSGEVAPRVRGRALPLLRAEGVLAPGSERVDMARARWDGT